MSDYSAVFAVCFLKSKTTWS
jgi:hypothetical protein